MYEIDTSNPQVARSNRAGGIQVESGNSPFSVQAQDALVTPKVTPYNSTQRRWRGIVSMICCIFAVVAMLELFTTPGAEAKTTTAQRGRIICEVFGPVHCRLAVRVARCESGLHPWAANGQYRGLFQVSRGLRAGYAGYGAGAWRQARHALRVFNASGRNWYKHWRWSARCWAR